MKTMRYIFFYSLLFLVGYSASAQNGTVKDIDSNVYKTVKIGTQVWMAENLKTAHYRDGSPIPKLGPDSLWTNTNLNRTGAWCYYQNDSGNNPTYGKLYNWYTVIDTHGLCPTGWHVPSDNEWTVLTDYLGGERVSGGKMKAKTLWKNPNTGADNSSGFTTLPAGLRSLVGTFYYLGLYGNFWSSAQSAKSNASDCTLNYETSDVTRDIDNLRNGLSVRCVGD